MRIAGQVLPALGRDIFRQVAEREHPFVFDVEVNVRVVFGSGILGSAVGGVIGYMSGDTRLRLANSLGVGFLVGASIGALVGMFEQLIGRI